ncbi:MAG TPA: M20/M25/M40 family metallo-hydrolase [Clostridia bacterium]|nr:M20/M25/M40 family metallo-hydrolase [Clostridia bacterium]
MKNRKILIFATLFLIIVSSLTVYYKATAYQETVFSEKEIKSKISAESMMSTIKYISKAPRRNGTGELKKVASYLASELKKMKYSTQIQKFNYKLYVPEDLNPKVYFKPVSDKDKDGTSENIVAIKSSKVKNAPILVISAHYDTYMDSVGAVDNASGVAVVTETARILKDVSLPFEIQFVLFSGEEVGGFGSKAYISSMNQSVRKRVKGALNIDSIGFKQKDGYTLMSCRAVSSNKNHLPQEVDSDLILGDTSNMITNLFKNNKRLDLLPGVSSDHFAFSVAGIPSASILGKLNRELIQTINTSNDTIDKIDKNRLVESTEFVVFAINKLKVSGFK